MSVYQLWERVVARQCLGFPDPPLVMTALCPCLESRVTIGLPCVMKCEQKLCVLALDERVLGVKVCCLHLPWEALRGLYMEGKEPEDEVS